MLGDFAIGEVAAAESPGGTGDFGGEAFFAGADGLAGSVYVQAEHAVDVAFVGEHEGVLSVESVDYMVAGGGVVHLYRFEQLEIYAAIVRNVSRLGSRISKAPRPHSSSQLRGSGRGLRRRNLHDPIVPFVRGRSGPYQHESLNDIRQSGSRLTRKTPAHRPCASRKSPKWQGIVLRSEVTRIRFSFVAKASTVGSGTPSSLASRAERKSIAGSRRRQPVTIASWRLASPRKRTIGQLRRETLCCIRSNVILTSGGVGCAVVKASSSRSRSAMSASTSF